MHTGFVIRLLLLFSLSTYYLGSAPLCAQTLPQAEAWLQEAEQAIYDARHLDQALLINEKAKGVFLRAGQPDKVRHSQLLTIAAHLQREDFKPAWKQLEALKKLAPTENTHVQGLLLTNQAWALWGLARYDEALIMADSAAAYWLPQKNWEQYSYALLLGAYAIYFDKTSDFSALEARLIRLSTTVKAAVLPSRLVARHLYQLQSAVQRQQGHIDRAIAYSLGGLRYEQQALAESQQARDSARVAKTYSQLGKLYADNGALEQSVGYYSQAFYWYKALENYGELIKLCTRLGDLQHRLKHFAQARFYYSNLQLYWPKLPKSPIWQRRNNTYIHLAKAYYYQYFEYHDSLLSYYDRELPYLKKNQLAVDKAYLNIGRAATALEQYPRAKEAYQAALKYTEQKYGQKGSRPAELYWTLGQLAYRQDNYVDAVAHFDQALEALSPNSSEEQDTLLSAELFSDKALAAKIYRTKADFYLSQGRYRRARHDFDQVVELAHYLRDNYTGAQSKFSSAQQLRPIYEKAALCVWKEAQNRPDRAAVEAIFQYAERSKASLLQEHLLKFRNQYAHAGIGVPDSLLQQEEQFLIQIARYREQERAAKRNQNQQQATFYFDKTFELQQQLQALEQELGQRYPHYKTWDHGRSLSPNLTTVQANLRADQVLVEYFVTDDYCFIIYITQQKAVLEARSKHKRGRFEKKLRQLRHLLSHYETAQEDSTTYTTLAAEAFWLYQHYLDHPLLDDKKELLLLPDQDLHYIPFEALLYEAPNGVSNTYEQLPYLLRRYAIHYHYSAALLLRTQRQVNTQSGQVLGFAASYGLQNDYLTMEPALRRERSQEEVQMHNYSSPIPGTLDELTFLQQHFKGDFFVRPLASERKFKEFFSQRDYGVVHLAMHGTINYNQPAYSSLVFTENLDSLEDNLLYVYETQHLNGQRANLVVLSACKTGYGRYAEGEGIISLGRSFIHAGVPSVVMTLWELNDATSIGIMADFYSLLSEGATKDEALRQAKLNYLDTQEGLTAHPFFWASTILIGNAVNIPVKQRQQPWMIWALIGGLLGATFFSWRWFGR